MNSSNSKPIVQVLRKFAKVTELVYRNIALSLIVLGWLGELAIMAARNFVGGEPGWTVELSTLALVYGSLMYMGLVTRHIGFTLVTRKFQGHKILSRIEPLISLVIVGILFVYSIQSVTVAYRDGGTAIETPGFNYPNWLVVIVTPIMFFTLFVHLMHRFVKPHVDPVVETIE